MSVSEDEKQIFPDDSTEEPKELTEIKETKKKMETEKEETEKLLEVYKRETQKTELYLKAQEGMLTRINKIELFLNEGFAEQVKNLMVEGLRPFVENTQKQFEGINAKLQTGPAWQAGKTEEGEGGVVGTILRIIDKGITAAAKGGTKDDTDINDLRNQLTKIYFTGMLKRAKKDFGVLSEVAEHLPLE